MGPELQWAFWANGLQGRGASVHTLTSLPGTYRPLVFAVFFLSFCFCVSVKIFFLSRPSD